MTTSIYMVINMPFAERLVTLRKEQHLTQEALANKIGLTKAQVYRYEKATSQPTMEVLKQMAIALNTSIDELVFDDNERDPEEDLKLRFELIQQMGQADKDAIKSILDGMIVKHQTKVTIGNLEK